MVLSSVQGKHFYLVGIKGTGMAALAELLHKKGGIVSGSDVHEQFYTDQILTEIGIPYYEGFSVHNLKSLPDMVIYSAAYDPEDHVELQYLSESGIPMIPYNRALSEIALSSIFGGIAGVHGKTTTTAMTASILSNTSVPVSVLVGSSVSSLGDRSVLYQGDTYFVAETCEYRRHFLWFKPKWLIITSIEPDHLDYYTGYEDIFYAFLEYGRNIQEGGTLLYCADDKGARDLSEMLVKERQDIHLIPYGKSATGPYRITRVKTKPGEIRFSLSGFSEQFSIYVPGEHNAVNASAAIALTEQLLLDANGDKSIGENEIRTGLTRFAGSRRRSEVLGESGGILFIDDYGHHPTAIRKTLRGFMEFYPGRRIVVDFMSHTYSRTRALLHDFGEAFADADYVILHKIYASARETKGDIRGEDLFEAVRMHNTDAEYFPEIMDAFDHAKTILRPGDIFLTMGAGNNWVLGRELFEHFKQKGKTHI